MDMDMADFFQAISTYAIPSGEVFLNAAQRVSILGTSKASPKVVARLRDILCPHVKESEKLCTVLKKALNALSPISDLPDEVLSHIMVTISRSIYHQEICYDNKPNLEWLALAQVCHRWRAVALHTLCLWAYIRQPSERVLLELVNRAKTAPLHINLACHAFCSDMGGVLGHIANNLERVQELRLTARTRDMRHFDQKLLNAHSTSSSRLRRLVVEEVDRRGTDLTIVQSAFHHPTYLQHLELRNVAIPWRDPIFTSPLTTLIFVLHERPNRYDSWEVPGLGSHPEFQGAMASLAPTLEVLELSCSVPGLDGETGPSVHQGDFTSYYPRLRRLKVTTYTHVCAHLLNWMVLHQSCSIQLRLSGYTSFEDVVSKLSEHFRLGGHSLPSLAVHYHPTCGMTLKGLATCKFDADPRVSHRRDDIFNLIDLKISIHVSAQEDVNDRMPYQPFYIVLMHGTSLLQSVRDLNIVATEFEKLDWSTLFARVPKLEVLYVESEDFVRALELLYSQAPVHASSDGQTPDSVPVPHLRSIHLQDIKFHEDPEDIPMNVPESDIDTSRLIGFFDGLCYALETRLAAGYQLDMLWIGKQCRNVKMQDVEKLRTLVPTVVIDSEE